MLHKLISSVCVYSKDSKYETTQEIPGTLMTKSLPKFDLSLRSYSAKLSRSACASVFFLTWWACWRSSILSWRIWQSYSLLFLSIWRLNFSTAVLSSSCCFSVRSSPNFITVSCCKALYKVASSSWILWSMQYQKPVRDGTLFKTQWGLGRLWQIQAPAWWSLCSGVQKCDKQNS